MAAVDRLFRSGETLYVTLQNLAEAWRAMTAPAGANGLGFSVAASANALGQIRRAFVLLAEDVPAVSVEWERLVVARQVVSRATHDARLAAAMIVHKIDRILTFNAADFTRLGIAVLDPATM